MIHEALFVEEMNKKDLPNLFEQIRYVLKQFIKCFQILPLTVWAFPVLHLPMPKSSTGDSISLQPEPIGSSPPRLTNENDGQKVKRKSGTSFAFVCPAQASPIPSFRYTV